MTKSKNHDCLFCANEASKYNPLYKKNTVYCSYHKDFISSRDYGPPPRRNLGFCKGFYVDEKMKKEWKEREKRLEKYPECNENFGDAKRASDISTKKSVRSKRFGQFVFWGILIFFTEFLFRPLADVPDSDLEGILVIVFILFGSIAFVKFIGFIFNE